MSRKTLSIILLLGIILSACGGQTEQATEPPTTTSTNTSVPTNTPVPTDTPGPVESLTPEPTVTEVPPDNAADCTNTAAFVSDVSISDNTEVMAGAALTKTWRVRNTGTCIWWSGYTLSHYSDQRMSAPDSVPLPRTNPGETADISVDLVAPSLPGTYQGNFVIKNPSDLIMQVDNDSRLWLIIKVVTPPTTSPTSDAISSTTPANAACALTLDAAKTDAMISALTAYRAKSSLPALPVNAKLSQAAQTHANDMACNQLFYHNGSDGSTPKTRVAAAGYTASDVIENVYGSYPPLDGQGVITWWATDQADTRHNENLLTTKYTEIGVGYAFFDNYGYYVIVFATP